MKKLTILFIFILFTLIPVISVSAQSPTKRPVATKIDNDLPKLTIVSPEEGSQILGSKVTVTFVVNNFIFTDYSKRPKKTAGEGHMHVWLDEENPSLENTQKITKATTFTLEDVPQGNHELVLELVNNDHSSFNPAVQQLVIFSTKQQVPQPSIIVSPTEPEKVEERKRDLQMLTSIGVTSLLGFLIFVLFALILLRRKNL